MHSVRGLTALASATFLAGCGGGSETYSLEPTVSCLRDAGADVRTGDEAVDYIAQFAANGALIARVGETEAIVSFGRTSRDAGDTAAEYEAFNVSDEELTQKGNAVVAWTKTPTDRERETVEGCLDDA